MSQILWTLLAIIESVAAAWLVLPLVEFVIKLVRSRADVLLPNWAYFFGMFVPYALLLIPVSLLVWHVIWIARKLTRKPISN